MFFGVPPRAVCRPLGGILLGFSWVVAGRPPRAVRPSGPSVAGGAAVPRRRRTHPAGRSIRSAGRGLAAGKVNGMAVDISEEIKDLDATLTGIETVLDIE